MYIAIDIDIDRQIKRVMPFALYKNILDDIFDISDVFLNTSYE